MKAGVLKKFAAKPAIVVEENLDEPKLGSEDSIKVAVKSEGICRSDWHEWMGDWDWVGIVPKLPIIPGHEITGIVEKVGSRVKNFVEGDRVIVRVAIGDGKCDRCARGLTNICENVQEIGYQFDGGYGEVVSVPVADFNVFHLPNGVSFEAGSYMGCRFGTAFNGVYGKGEVRAGDRMVVHGLGGIGLGAVNIGSAIGAEVTAVDFGNEKLQLAKKCGAKNIVDATGKTNDELIKEIVDLTWGGADVSLDALGIATTCLNAIRCLRPGGRHIQIGMTSQAEKGIIGLPIDRIIAYEIKIVGNLDWSRALEAPMIKMVQEGKINPELMINRKISIDQASDVVEGMTDYKTVGVTVINKW